MSEAGLQGFNIVAWVAFVAPAGDAERHRAQDP